jgi:acetylornithine/succinyldiaminopimelate/putrescine aminotransferase
VASAFEPGDHASTFGGQPLATAAARAVLAVMEEQQVPDRATKAGAYLTEGLSSLPGVVEVRGMGLLIAAQLEPGLPAGVVVEAALHGGLVVNAVTPTAIRLAPPLLVSREEMDEALSILGGALSGVRSGLPGSAAP